MGTRFQSNRESLEAFCTISCIVGNFETVGCVVRELVQASSADEVLEHIGTDKSQLVFFWGEGNLSPESLEFLGIMLKITTKMMFLLMGEVNCAFKCDLLFVVDLSSLLE